MANAPMAQRTTPPMMMRGALSLVRVRSECVHTRRHVGASVLRLSERQRRDHTRSRGRRDRLSDCVIGECERDPGSRLVTTLAMARRGMPRARGIPRTVLLRVVGCLTV